MTASPALMALDRCHYCSKFLPAWRLHRLGDGSAQRICDRCLEWNAKAIEFLAGGPIPGCQECGATWETLRDRTPEETVRLFVVPKDGIYSVLCQPCKDGYVLKRSDLFKGTAYGHILKL